MEMLLIQRKHPPFQGHWALPGGFVDEGETLEQAAAREVEEETGYRVETHADLVQVGAFGDPGRDPRGWTVTVAYALAVPRTKPVEGADDATRAQVMGAVDSRRLMQGALSLLWCVRLDSLCLTKADGRATRTLVRSGFLWRSCPSRWPLITTKSSEPVLSV